MVGDMVSRMALQGIFLIILGITQFALSFWAIIEIVTFDKNIKVKPWKLAILREFLQLYLLD